MDKLHGMTCDSCEAVVELTTTTNCMDLQEMTAGWVQVPLVMFGTVSWWTLCGTCGSPEALAQGLVDLAEALTNEAATL